MRRSSLRFNRSNLSKISKQNLLRFAASLSVVAFVFSTCRSRPEVDSITTESIKADAPLIELGSDVEPSWIPLRDGNGKNSEIIAWLGAKSCIEPTLMLKSKLITAVSNNEIIIEQPWDTAISDINVESTSIRIATSILAPTDREGLCNAVRAGVSPVILPVEISSSLKSGVERAIAAIVPDCSNVESTTDGWRCSLKTLMPQAAIVQVEDLQQAMIKRWSRQPYIIARKAGVTMSLARISTNLTTADSFNKFCKLLQFSLPEELPLVMTSPSWQKGLCDGNDKDRREISFHGLAKAIEELNLLRQLYENTSKVGLFSVRIPDHEIPGRAPSGPQPFRIIITPEADVTDRLVEVASTMLGRPATAQGRKLRHTASTQTLLVPAGPRKPSCWHPIFSDSPTLLRVAEGMRLTGEGFKGECRTGISLTAATGTLEALAKYLMQSLASETEFVMDNGQSKLLRLPEGGYKYSVQVLPQNPIDAEESVEEATPESHGDLSWGTAKNHAIRSW